MPGADHLDQGSPSPWTGTGPCPVGTQAAQPAGSGGWASEASPVSAAAAPRQQHRLRSSGVRSWRRAGPRGRPGPRVGARRPEEVSRARKLRLAPPAAGRRSRARGERAQSALHPGVLARGPRVLRRGCRWERSRVGVLPATPRHGHRGQEMTATDGSAWTGVGVTSLKSTDPALATATCASRASLHAGLSPGKATVGSIEVVCCGAAAWAHRRTGDGASGQGAVLWSERRCGVGGLQGPVRSQPRAGRTHVPHHTHTHVHAQALVHTQVGRSQAP